MGNEESVPISEIPKNPGEDTIGSVPSLHDSNNNNGSIYQNQQPQIRSILRSSVDPGESLMGGGESNQGRNSGSRHSEDGGEAPSLAEFSIKSGSSGGGRRNVVFKDGNLMRPGMSPTTYASSTTAPDRTVRFSYQPLDGGPCIHGQIDGTDITMVTATDPSSSSSPLTSTSPRTPFLFFPSTDSSLTNKASPSPFPQPDHSGFSSEINHHSDNQFAYSPPVSQVVQQGRLQFMQKQEDQRAETTNPSPLSQEYHRHNKKRDRQPSGANSPTGSPRKRQQISKLSTDFPVGFPQTMIPSSGGSHFNHRLPLPVDQERFKEIKIRQKQNHQQAERGVSQEIFAKPETPVLKVKMISSNSKTIQMQRPHSSYAAMEVRKRQGQMPNFQSNGNSQTPPFHSTVQPTSMDTIPVNYEVHMSHQFDEQLGSLRDAPSTSSQPNFRRSQIDTSSPLTPMAEPVFSSVRTNGLTDLGEQNRIYQRNPAVRQLHNYPLGIPGLTSTSSTLPSRVRSGGSVNRGFRGFQASLSKIFTRPKSRPTTMDKVDDGSPSPYPVQQLQTSATVYSNNSAISTNEFSNWEDESNLFQNYVPKSMRSAVKPANSAPRLHRKKDHQRLGDWRENYSYNPWIQGPQTSTIHETRESRWDIDKVNPNDDFILY